MSGQSVIELQKNASEKVIVQAREFKGRRYVDARLFYLKDGPGGEDLWAPCQKGLCLQPELAVEVATAMLKLAGSEGVGGEG